MTYKATFKRTQEQKKEMVDSYLKMCKACKDAGLPPISINKASKRLRLKATTLGLYLKEFGIKSKAKAVQSSTPLEISV